MTPEEKKQALIHKSFVVMIRILFIFGVPAAAAFFVGRWLDTTYDMRPFGSLFALAVAFIFSWTLVIRMYFKMTAEFAEVEKQQHEEQQKRQQQIQANLSKINAETNNE